MKKLLTNLFDFEREETAGEILAFRLFELGMAYWVLHYAWTWAFYILKIGDVVLPLGIAQHIDISFMFSHHLSLFNAAAITILLGVGFFRLWRFGYVSALLLMHIQYTARFSLGEISHGANIAGMVLLALALGALFFRDSVHAHRFTYGFSYLFLGLGYMSAATCKLVASGPLWVDGHHMWLWIGERTVDTFSLSGQIDYNWLQELTLNHVSIATLILSFGLLTELFAFLMWFKRTRPWIMTLLIGMHIGVLFTMKISFPANVAMLLLLAYPWGSWIDKGLMRMNVSIFDRRKHGRLRFT